VQYIGALMRKIDPAPIEEAVRSREEKDREQAELHKQVEAWRNELIKGNDTLARELSEKLPEQEKPRFTGLVEKARAEAAKQNPNPTPSRMLFRFLFAFSNAIKK
jgi:ribosome-associated protein